MNKLIVTLIASFLFASPTLAGGPVTREVRELRIRENYPEEVKNILTQLNDLEVDVYLAPDKQFPKQYRGLYYPDKNMIYLNNKYVNNDEELLKILRHEGWHVAQDCMSTLANSTLLNVLDHHIIPIEIKEETIERYGLDPYVVRIEREAVWASTIPGMTATALSVCNSEFPMWEEYDPPSRTRSWLYINGYL